MFGFRDNCSVPSICCVQTNQTRNVATNTENHKSLPPPANENTIKLEHNTNMTAEQTDRHERGNFSFDQVNFMSQFKNLTTAKHFHSTDKWDEPMTQIMFTRRSP